ncbi:hypothetical protein LIA77_09925 [Sarocladium implicatum]|nr:hypothetical protein LIA77_09925 [Sarocladium implicatum]
MRWTWGVCQTDQIRRRTCSHWREPSLPYLVALHFPASISLRSVYCQLKPSKHSRLHVVSSYKVQEFVITFIIKTLRQQCAPPAYNTTAQATIIRSAWDTPTPTTTHPHPPGRRQTRMSERHHVRWACPQKLLLGSLRCGLHVSPPASVDLGFALDVWVGDPKMVVMESPMPTRGCRECVIDLPRRRSVLIAWIGW